MADSKIIKAKLRRLLAASDWQVATQRSITEALEEQLEIGPLDEYKALIKAEIDAYLLETRGADGEEEGSDGDYQPGGEEEEADEAGPAKKKQKAAGGAVAAQRDGPPDAEFSVALSAKRFLSLRRFKGKLFVDVREWYDKDGALAPGAKGLALPPEQWSTLSARLPELTAALEAKDDTAAPVQLSATRRAGVSGFGGRHNLDLREFYEKGGELLPSKKGVSLTPDQWGKLVEAAPEVTAQLEAALGAPLPAPAAQGTAPAAPAPAPAAAAQGEAGPSGAPAAAAAPAADAVGVVQLGGARRAEARSFKGRPLIDIREYYEKGGELLPGKKGISLGPQEYGTLRSRAADLSAALAARDTAFVVELSDKRRATINSFKGRFSVDIREYYEKEGELRPGFKGTCLGEEQWKALCEGMAGLDAAMQALGS